MTETADLWLIDYLFSPYVEQTDFVHLATHQDTLTVEFAHCLDWCTQLQIVNLLDILLRKSTNSEVITRRVELLVHQERFVHFELSLYAFDDLECLLDIVETEVDNLVWTHYEAEDAVATHCHQFTNLCTLLVRTGIVLDHSLRQHVKYFDASTFETTKSIFAHHDHVLDW